MNELIEFLVEYSFGTALIKKDEVQMDKSLTNLNLVAKQSWDVNNVANTLPLKKIKKYSIQFNV